jgi:hypothetical protein
MSGSRLVEAHLEAIDAECKSLRAAIGELRDENKRLSAALATVLERLGVLDGTKSSAAKVDVEARQRARTNALIDGVVESSRVGQKLINGHLITGG